MLIGNLGLVCLVLVLITLQKLGYSPRRGKQKEKIAEPVKFLPLWSGYTKMLFTSTIEYFCL
jgi:hypothetical protein